MAQIAVKGPPGLSVTRVGHEVGCQPGAGQHCPVRLHASALASAPKNAQGFLTKPFAGRSLQTTNHLAGFVRLHAGEVMSSVFRISIISHVAAIAVGAVAATAYLTVYSASRQSLADYFSAICAKAFISAPAWRIPTWPKTSAR